MYIHYFSFAPFTTYNCDPLFITRYLVMSVTSPNRFFFLLLSKYIFPCTIHFHLLNLQQKKPILLFFAHAKNFTQKKNLTHFK